MLKYIVFLGAAVSLFGAATYIKEMLKGKAKPNRLSWLIWSISPLIAFFASISSGFTLAAIPIFTSGIAPLIIFTVSLFKKEAYWKIETKDYVCGAFSIIALVLWYITKNPITAIILAVAGDTLAALPTIIKGWKYPETESAAPFCGGLFNALTSFIALEKWNIQTIIFPIYLVLINIILIFAIIHKKIMPKK